MFAKFLTLIILLIILAVNITTKSKHPVLKSFLNASSGVFTLAVFKYISNFTGLLIPLNLATISVSSFLGIPGIFTIIAVNKLFGLNC